MIGKTGALLLLFVAFSTSQNKKWVWENNGRSSKDSPSTRSTDEKRAEPRYQVDEYIDRIEPRPPLRPPGFGPPPAGYETPVAYPFGPGNNVGFGGLPQGGLYGTNGPYQGYGQGGVGRPQFVQGGVLTGPVPSWVREPALKDLDRCKCTEKFNCNSPGISYGQCDIGKQYCCYNSKGNALAGSPVPPRPVYSSANGVLAGPGGPVDQQFGGRPRPSYTGQRPRPRPPVYEGAENGVLVGPGGPTGIVYRPNGNRGSEGGFASPYDGSYLDRSLKPKESNN